MTYLELETKVFEEIKEQYEFAQGLEYAMGEVISSQKGRISALRSMCLHFIDELEDLDWELSLLEEDK